MVGRTGEYACQKEVIYSGDEVVALTQKYLSKEDVAFVHKALVYAVECTVANIVNQASLTLSTLFR